MSKKITIILFSVILLLLFLLTGFFIVKQIYNELLDDLVDQYSQEKLVLAHQTSRIIEDEIRATEDKLKLIAGLPEVRDGSSEVCHKKLEEVAKLNSRVSNLGRVNEQKQFQCSLNKALMGTDPEKLGPYIAQIFNDPEHKPVMSRIIKLPNGGYAVAVHVPVFKTNGEFSGTVGGAIYFEDFSKKFLTEVDVSERGYVVLQDDDGTIFYHPQSNLIGQNRRPKNPQEEATASAITPLIIKGSIDGSSGTSRYISSLDNKEKLGAYAPVDVFPGRRWMVIVTVPIEEILSLPLITESRGAFFRLFLLVIASILITPILLLIYLVISVFRPLEKIGKAAVEIGKGNLDVEIPIKSNDEIGILAGLFNEMVIKLKMYQHNLEEKVNEKTSALTEKLVELENHKKATVNLLEDLNEEKEKLSNVSVKDEAILGSIGDGLIVLDEYGKVSKINHQALTMLGYSKEEIIDKWLFKVVQAVDDKNIPVAPEDRPASEALSTGQVVSRRYYYVKKDGTKLPVALTVSPLLINEKPVGAIEVIRDITKEKEVEKLKDEFVSLASHELRTPMTAIKGFVSMIQEGDFGPISKKLEDPIAVIGTSTDRLIHLVNDMLNVARIEAGRLKFTLTDFPIKPVIEEVLSTLQPIAKQKSITLEAKDLTEAKVQADLDKVKQVLNNLLGNSLKFTDQGGILVWMRTDADLIKVYVTDTGGGISSEDQKKLFGKFRQISSQQEGKPTGTGLGLYLSRELIRKMGGDMWIEQAEVGKGSTFAFSIPISKTTIAQKIKKEVENDEQVNPDKV